MEIGAFPVCCVGVVSDDFTVGADLLGEPIAGTEPFSGNGVISREFVVKARECAEAVIVGCQNGKTTNGAAGVEVYAPIGDIGLNLRFGQIVV